MELQRYYLRQRLLLSQLVVHYSQRRGQVVTVFKQVQFSGFCCIILVGRRVSMATTVWKQTDCIFENMYIWKYVYLKICIFEEACLLLRRRGQDTCLSGRVPPSRVGFRPPGVQTAGLFIQGDCLEHLERSSSSQMHLSVPCMPTAPRFWSQGLWCTSPMSVTGWLATSSYNLRRPIRPRAGIPIPDGAWCYPVISMS